MSAPVLDSDSEENMNWEYMISGMIGFGLIIYLTYALLKPEKF
jgi:K+-transporting ATPase KdpF subunit